MVPDLSIQPELVEVCHRISENAAVPLPAVLRAALPPGIETGRYRPSKPLPGSNPDTSVTRATLRRALGRDGLRAAEAEGRFVLFPAAPRPKMVEWAEIRAAADPDLARAPRQRELFVALKERGGAGATSGASPGPGLAGARARLVRRGAVRLVRRPEPAPLLPTSGDSATQGPPFSRTARSALKSGGAFLWRTAGSEERDAVAAVVGATLGDGGQALVLAPEVRSVERMVDHLRRVLPPIDVARYHDGLVRQGRVHEAGP